MNNIFWVMLGWYVLTAAVCLGRKNNGLVDIFWGLGFLGVSGASLLSADHPPLELQCMTGLIWIWGLRLSFYLYRRNWNKPEDFRYANFRKGWGKNWILSSLIKVYLLQAILMQVICIPVYVIACWGNHPNTSTDARTASVACITGTLVSLLGIFIEALADWQKSKFKQDARNDGKICQVGLWSISRHPNYLGEIFMWLGVGLIPLQSPWGGIALISPIFLTFLLYKVSGVPLLEERLRGRADFEAYCKKTGAIFPRV